MTNLRRAGAADAADLTRRVVTVRELPGATMAWTSRGTPEPGPGVVRAD